MISLLPPRDTEPVSHTLYYNLPEGADVLSLTLARWASGLSAPVCREENGEATCNILYYKPEGQVHRWSGAKGECEPEAGGEGADVAGARCTRRAECDCGDGFPPDAA